MHFHHFVIESPEPGLFQFPAGKDFCILVHHAPQRFDNPIPCFPRSPCPLLLCFLRCRNGITGIIKNAFVAR
jgi:hypothetical protein